jgi:hypothetical protein
MLNDNEATPSGETVFIRKPENNFQSFDMFRTSVTDLELLAANRFDRYKGAPQRGKYFHSKDRLPSSGLLVSFA